MSCSTRGQECVGPPARPESCGQDAVGAPPRPQVEKYRPTRIKDIVGNTEAVSRLQVWHILKSQLCGCFAQWVH